MRDDKLHTFSWVHLRYEIDMLRKTAVLLATGVTDGVLKNVLVESYAVHLRTLTDFLYARPKPPDDLGAGHYVKDRGAWVRERGAISKPLEDAQQRVSKQIVHFTKKRFTSGAPESLWHPELEVPALIVGLRLFLRHADPAKLHRSVSHAVAGLASLLPAQTRPDEEDR